MNHRRTGSGAPDTRAFRRSGGVRLHGRPAKNSTRAEPAYPLIEHTLGVLALVAHFRPEDELLRVAALLHDIGHLPLSHTLEGVAGLDHHAIGVQLVQSDPIRPVLEKHVRRLARQLLDSTPLAPARLARMTDPQLWTAFDSCAVTQAESTMDGLGLFCWKVTSKPRAV